MSFPLLRHLAPLLALAACADAPRAATAEDSATGAAVIDDVGRTVVVPRAPRRIVSLIPSISDVVVALGAADRLIARTDYDTDARLARLPSVGGGLTPNLEWLASNRPELMFSWADRSSRSLVGRLSQMGVPTYAASIETLDDIRRTIRNTGLLLGLGPRADSLLAHLESTLDSVSAAVAGRARPRVLYVVATDPLIVAGPGTYIDELIRLAGGRNVADELSARWPQLSLEEVLRRDPEVVVVPQLAGSAPPLATLRAAPGWGGVAAVRSGRVHAVDTDRFNRPGPAVPEIARTLARLFHDGTAQP